MNKRITTLIIFSGSAFIFLESYQSVYSLEMSSDTFSLDTNLLLIDSIEDSTGIEAEILDQTDSIQLLSLDIPRVLDMLQNPEIHVMVINTGSFATKATGNLVIKNVLGQQVFQEDLESIILDPNTTTELHPKDATPENVIAYKPWVLLGPYQVELSYGSSGDNSHIITQRLIGLPISALITLIVALVIYHLVSSLLQEKE